jgi:ABC-type glutathione transport system ATPase component
VVRLIAEGDAQVDPRQSAGAGSVFRHRQDLREIAEAAEVTRMGAAHELAGALESRCAWYGAAQILYDVSLEVGRGEVVALMGRNGAGKSTTLKALMGMLMAQSTGKRCASMGQDISKSEPHQIARLGLGFVPEDRRVFTDLTVMENLEVGKQPPRKWADGSARRRCGRPNGCSSCSPTSAKCRTARAAE